ncbi:MAG: hypothetical protein ACR2LJ_10110, partial [Acidimicrobiales bacterium]
RLVTDKQAIAQGSAQGAKRIVAHMANLFRDMQRQWDHDGHSRDAQAALARWVDRHPDLVRFTSPADLVVAAHSRTDAAARLLVDDLTEEAAADPWAARTVLQAVLPGLARLTRDNADMVGSAYEPFASIEELDQYLVCTAFERITEVAAEVPQFRLRTILNTTWYRLRSLARAHHREQAARGALTDDAVAPPSRTEAEQLALTLVDAVQRQLLRSVDAGLVYTTRVAGHPTPDVAAALDWTPRVLHRRRNRVESVLIADEVGEPRPRYCLATG